jgi:hypothetical protein
MSSASSQSILDKFKIKVASQLAAPTGLPRSKQYREQCRQLPKVDPLAAERKEQAQINVAEISKQLEKAIEVILATDPAALLGFKNRVKLSFSERRKKITITQGLVEVLCQHPAMAYHLRCAQEKTKGQLLNRPASNPDSKALHVANDLLASIAYIRSTNPQLLLDFKKAQERDCPREDTGLRICLRSVLWSYARGNFVDTPPIH